MNQKMISYEKWQKSIWGTWRRSRGWPKEELTKEENLEKKPIQDDNSEDEDRDQDSEEEPMEEPEPKHEIEI